MSSVLFSIFSFFLCSRSSRTQNGIQYYSHAIIQTLILNMRKGFILSLSISSSTSFSLCRCVCLSLPISLPSRFIEIGFGLSALHRFFLGPTQFVSQKLWIQNECDKIKKKNECKSAGRWCDRKYLLRTAPTCPTPSRSPFRISTYVRCRA